MHVSFSCSSDVYFQICSLSSQYFLTVLYYVIISDAAARGVQPEQIIFTDVAMKGEHIRRSSLADLCLDT